MIWVLSSSFSIFELGWETFSSFSLIASCLGRLWCHLSRLLKLYLSIVNEVESIILALHIAYSWTQTSQIKSSWWIMVHRETLICAQVSYYDRRRELENYWQDLENWQYNIIIRLRYSTKKNLFFCEFSGLVYIKTFSQVIYPIHIGFSTRNPTKLSNINSIERN